MSKNEPNDATTSSPVDPWEEQLTRRLQAGRGMPRRVFLKITGMSGLALGWGCSSSGGHGSGTAAGQGGLSASGAGAGALAGGGGAVGGSSPGGSGGSSPGGSGGSAGGQAGGGGAAGTGPAGSSGSAGAGGPGACEGDCPCGPSTETPAPPAPGPSSQVNAYVRIGTDDTVTLYCSKSEMGQGVMTALPMMLAEELGVDWTKVRSEHPTPGPSYGDQNTYGSSSVPNTYQLMRQMGAAAREMLIAAAAQTWSVPAAECRVELGEVIHDGSSRRARYGELAQLAATMDPPQNPRLKDTSQYTIIGTPRAQLGARDKAAGIAQFGIDVSVPDMVYAVVAFPPDIGGRVGSYDDKAALAVSGVRAVVQLAAGVAVLADNTWAALQGRAALVVNWVGGPNASLNTEAMRASMMGVMGGGTASVNQGNAETVFADAAAGRTIEAEYELPYLAHAAMEPLNAVAHVNAGRVEVWAGTQVPASAVAEAARVAGVSQQNVTLHIPLLGGAFGRRATSDFIALAVEASRESGLPVKLMYTREDDTRAGQYRPMNAHRIRGSVDASGNPESWIHDIVVQPVLSSAFAVEGAATSFYYAIANRRVSWTDPRQGVPVFTWRSVGASHNAFVVESFLDELAALGGRDPLELRLALLAGDGSADAMRIAAALQDVALRSGWATPPAAGRGRGIACHQTFGSIVAQVVEASVEDGQVRVHKVWTTVDCGLAVNPRGIEAQVEGSICFGLSAALFGEITLANGGAVQTNFDAYPLLRMADAPECDVSIINSGAAMTGMGEPAVPPVAPALCNAIFQATGQRIRRLPIRLA